MSISAASTLSSTTRTRRADDDRELEVREVALEVTWAMGKRTLKVLPFPAPSLRAVTLPP